MSFTERDFLLLSRENRIKKTAYAVRQFLDKEKDLGYLTFIAGLFNAHGDIRIKIPDSTAGWAELYDRLYNLLLEADPYLEKEPFDSAADSIIKIPVTAVLDNIRSPFNIGSIIRSSGAFGAGEVIVCGSSPLPDDKKVLKTSMRTLIRTSYEPDPVNAVKKLKALSNYIYAVEKTGGSIMIKEFTFLFPCTLIFGNEEFGISRELLDLSDGIVHIPISGHKNSINVASAAAIALYEVSGRYRT